jgi:amino acid adenylation domain-containing protein
VALVEGERRLTYAGLDARAATLARRLTAAGVAHGSVVATYAERSIELIVGYLAVLRAGGAYLPLDPGHPRERLVAMLEDAGVHVLLTTRRHQRLALSGVTTLALLDEPVGPVGAAPAARVQPDDRAYVMFTSGSTGRPKGVAVPHRAIVRLVFGQRYARFGPAERVLHLARPVFDASTFEIWGALLHGGACVIHPPGVPTPATLRAIIGRSGATTALFTTSLFNTIVDEDPEALRGLTQIGIGGEPLSPQHAARAAAALPGVELFNGYGPTETTTFAACHPMPRPIDAGAGSVPIGRPIAGAEAYVLDAHGTPVPAGVPGELYIGGTGLAHGYINRPDLTAERFVPHPFRADPGARLYRTGDVVRWRADGLLEFIGRRDGQVKIRGVRVELGEVEAALRADPRVRDAAVVAVETAAGERRLVAYVVPAGPPPRATALRAALLDRLPAAFVPAAFVALDALPLTPNGKLDRNALPAPAASRPSPTAPARGPLKRQLAAVWAELLGVEEVGAHDDFFDLGGHSLLAVRMLQRVQQLYGIALPLAVLYGDPTIDGVAAALLRHDAEAPPAPIVKLRDGDDRAPLFFFHGDLNGGGFYCRKLARHLRPGRTVWVVHPLGVDHARVPLSIEAMARQHVRDLTALAPDGPLVLGGYCNGGLVAWEAARLLAAEGRVVERVILIAADADTRFSRLRAPLIRAARLLGLGDGLADVQFGRVRAFASRVRARSPRGRVALAVRSAMHVTRQVAQQLRRHRPRPLAAGPLGRRYFDLVTSYVPPPWPGHAVVFWPAAEEPARRDDPTAGWGALAGRVDVHPIPGDHDEIVTRHIEEVAVLLGRYL